jgi:transcriptional regulator with XRE-family HTH domain
MPISSKQIRAARGLLNLSQKELAEKAGLSVNSLNNIERDVGSPRNDSFQSIKDALEKEGVEFLEKDGVRFAGEPLEIEKIEGPNILELFYADWLKAFPTGNGEVLIIGKDNKRFNHHDLALLMAYKKFEDAAIKNNIKERALFLENDTNFISRRNIYRWVPRELFGEVPMAIYGDNISIILWGPPTRMVIIRNHGIAETFRHHFEVAWSVAKPVPEEVYKFHYQLKTQKILEQAKKTGALKDEKPVKAAKKKKS